MRLCKNCGYRPVTGKPPSKYCEKCKQDDPNRNRGRERREVIVSVDCEGDQVDGLMYMLTMSYGREDGSSNSIHTSNPKQALLWLFDEIDDYRRDVKQVMHSFHFVYDIGLFAKAFDWSRLYLVHKSTAKNRNLLCDFKEVHKPGDKHDPLSEPCMKIHRHDPDAISEVIVHGGEGDLIAYDPVSHLAFATTSKRRFYVEYRPNGDRYEGCKVLDIHDHGSAFVGGLETVVDTWQPEMTKAERDIIAWGKANRKIPGALKSNPVKTAAYSEAECVADARCVRLLIETVRASAGIIIKPSQLYGSGSIAAAAFKYHKMQKRSEDHSYANDDFDITDLAEYTYFGGMIETPVIGKVQETINSEDINSAYPSHAIEIPCTRIDHGYWTSTHMFKPPPADCVMGYVKASWVVKTPSTPPFVVHTKHNEVRQPMRNVNIWVTLPEYRAAVTQFGKKITGVGFRYWQQTCDCPNPIGWMEDLYNNRKGIKKEMKQFEPYSDEWQTRNVRQEAIKLIINSCYGKLAQMRPQPGTYTNLHFASYITGATRAQLRERTWRKESMGATVVYQHTDSVKFVGAELEDEGKDLGKWGGEEPKDGMIIIQPGLAAPVNPEQKGASRGVDATVFQRVVTEYAAQEHLKKRPDKWPVIEMPLHRMTTLRMAVFRGKLHKASAFEDSVMEIAPNPNKRNIKAAKRMPGNPEAWIIPPLTWMEEPAELEDLRRFREQVIADERAGEYDYDDEDDM